LETFLKKHKNPAFSYRNLLISPEPHLPQTSVVVKSDCNQNHDILEPFGRFLTKQLITNVL